jgi:hypothetical protein
MSLLPDKRVGDLRQQDNAAPSLHPHYKGFNTTTGSSAPRYGIGILPHGVGHFRVDEEVTLLAPHRPGRAQLRHPVLHCTDLLTAWRSAA